MSFFYPVGQARAVVTLAAAQADGTQVQLFHSGGLAVTLYARIKSQNADKGAALGMSLTENRTLVLEIPTGQVGFAVATDEREPIKEGDKITYLSREFSVQLPIEKDRTGYVYTITAVERKRNATGVRS